MLTHWKNPQQAELPEFYPKLKAWLLDPSSLTAKLKRLHPDFRVELLFQEQQTCLPHEQAFLKIAADTPTLVREVILRSQNIPWVYARSILPLSALENENRALAELGTNPLGERLFSSPHIQPGNIQIAEFNSASNAGKINLAYHAKSERFTDKLWGRRRLFHLQQGSISVAEVFLSPVPCYDLALQSL